MGLAKNFLCLPSSTLPFMKDITPCEAARLYWEMISSLVPVPGPTLGKTLSLGLSVFIFKVGGWGVPGWLSRLSVRLHLRHIMILQFVGSSPASGSVLTAQSLEPASDSVCVSLSTPLLLMRTLSLSLSKVNIKKIFKVERTEKWME